MATHRRNRIGEALRRAPVRGAAVGAIAAGTVLFALASATQPRAGAEPHLAEPPPRSHGLDLSALLPVATTAPAPIAARTASRPVHSASPAVSALAANGIPSVALNAYRVAAARMDHADPGCGIGWWLLAGIGRVESDHGQFAGARLVADGTSTPQIIGIALNGHGTGLVPDTDHGRLDGDTVYDHAVGPMQFIPQTWAGFGADGNGDGVADVFNINDAALGAARYLCAAGGDVSTRAGQVQAVYTYNHSDAYVAEVLALADAYRLGIPVSGLPAGDTTAPLPPVRHTGPMPPADPGRPPAIGGSARTPSPVSRPAPTQATPASTAPAAAAAPTASPGAAAPSSAPRPVPSTSVPVPVSTPTPTPPGSPVPSPTAKCVLEDPLKPRHCLLYG